MKIKVMASPKDSNGSAFSKRHNSVSYRQSKNGSAQIVNNYAQLNENTFKETPMSSKKNSKFNLYGKYGMHYKPNNGNNDI